MKTQPPTDQLNKRMGRHNRRQSATGLSPLQKAYVRQAWRADCVNAGIHAFIGEDVPMLVQQAGGILSVVIFACEEARMGDEDADVRSVFVASKALVQLTPETGIDEKLRELIIEGLAACERLQPRLDIVSIHRATQEVLQASAGL
ncbi:MAG: hypothetical protein WA159_24925 [Variovorax sp.]